LNRACWSETPPPNHALGEPGQPHEVDKRFGGSVDVGCAFTWFRSRGHLSQSEQQNLVKPSVAAWEAHPPRRLIFIGISRARVGV